MLQGAGFQQYPSNQERCQRAGAVAANAEHLPSFPISPPATHCCCERDGVCCSVPMLPLPYHDRVFRSAEAAEDGCRDESSAGHRDASAAPGNPCLSTAPPPGHGCVCCGGMLIILSLLSLDNHISLPKHSLRYSPHIEVIFPLKQFKFWIKEYSKKQVWNKKIKECAFFCVVFPPVSFSLSRWGIWVFSSCCCFSYLQLLEWSSLATWVSAALRRAGGAG